MNAPGERAGGHDWLPITVAHATARGRIIETGRQRAGRRFDLLADGGCGKTVLLLEIATALRDLDHIVMFITPPEPGDPPSTAADRLRREVAICETLIKSLANDVPDDDELPGATEIASRMRKASAAGPAPNAGAERIAVSMTIENSPGATVEDAANVTLSFDETTRLVARLEAMRHALVAEIAQLRGLGPVALQVDDFHLLRGRADAPALPAAACADQWLLDVFAQLPEVLVVRAGHAHPADDQPAQGTTVLRLGPMTEAETRNYVRERLTRWTPERAEHIGGLIHGGTGGYPVWVATYCQMIDDSLNPDESPDVVAQWLSGGGDAPSIEKVLPRFRDFVDDTAAGLVGSRIPLFDQLCVLRRITDPDDPDNPTMISTLFDIDDDAAERLYEWLSGCAFMTDFDDDAEAGKRMQDRIRETAAAQFGQSISYRRLHEKAESYYREILHFDDEPNADSMWSQWSRYENPIWQRDSRDWLYHAAHVSNRAFEGTTEAMIRLFLEVFWWWDAYVPTDYSRDLLADYRAILDTRQALGRGRSTDDGVWLRRLEEFQANYVPGWGEVPGRHTANWRAVDKALRGLWNSLKLRTDPMPDADRNLRRIQILICCFRGDAARYATANGVQAAARWYSAAAAACGDGEEWIANWATYFHADLLLDSDPIESAKLVDGLPERIDDVADNEMRCHVTRLLADLAWRRGDLGLALDIHARSVLHGYVYQVRQELERQAPSAYTVGIYEEMRTRTEQRLAEAIATGHADIAAAATARMRGFFTPYWDELGTEPDNPQGFPPAPGPDDLNQLDTEYSDIVESVIDIMADQLDEPPDAPLPDE